LENHADVCFGTFFTRVMGVDGFWPIVSSTGRRVSLDILGNKILAIDASIWIYQFLSAMRDAEGNPLQGAHIIGFFRRICKLLFLRIKPVFVFDGPPIPLKFAALKKRRDDTRVSESAYKKAAQQLLLQNILKFKSNPDSLPAAPQHSSSGSDSSLDEILILSDSDEENENQMDRRMRLTVPDNFRGFLAERRTLDSVSLPVLRDPERPIPPKPAVEEAINFDESVLDSLPLHEQYRGLLQARQALLTHGRHNALETVSRGGEGSADLHSLSEKQMKAVVELARVTDRTHRVRQKMSREEHKEEEIYIQPPQFQQNQPKTRKRQKFYLEENFETGNLIQGKRRELLFGASPVKTEAPSAENLTNWKDDEEDESLAGLFGDGWEDIVGVCGNEKPVGASSSACEILESDDRSDAESESEISIESESEREYSEEVSGGAIEVVSEEESIAEESHHEIECEVWSEEEPNIPEEQAELDEESDEESVEICVSSDSENESIPPIDSPDESRAPSPAAVRPPPPDHFQFEPVEFFSESPDLVDILDDPSRERITFNFESVYSEIRDLLTLFGLPWVDAPADAEAQCAFLCQSGLVDGVISDDSDTLVFGSPSVFRHLYMGDSTVEMFRLSALSFSREELISLALLLGCDYTEGVHGVGPVNACEIVRVYPNLDALHRFKLWVERFHSDNGREADPVEGEDPDDVELIEFKKTHANYRSQWILPEDFPSQQVWNVFENPTVDRSGEGFTFDSMDEEGLKRRMAEFLKFEEIENLLNLIKIKINEFQLQRKITDYFNPVFDKGTVSEVVSKRLRNALSKHAVS
jgi:5'-3' exonuclease